MKGKQNPPSCRNITRMDYIHTHGWWVRIMRRGKEITKLFSDGVCGGKRKALKAAQEWRDFIKNSLPRHIRHGKARFWTEPPVGNTSGRVGVHYSEWTSHRSNGRVEYWAGWIATWNENKKAKTARFSIANHGHVKAFELAVEAREAAEKKLLNA